MNFMDIINVPAGYVIRFLSNLVGNNYMFTLILFAVAIEIVLLPFGIRQQRNTIKQAKLRPKEMAIRKKYQGRDDKPTQQKMQMEIQELYKRENFNPMSGCLPLLIQFPIIIALYNIVLNPLRYVCNLSQDAIKQVITVVNSFPEYAETVFAPERTIDLIDALRHLIADYGTETFSHVEGFADRITGVESLPNLTVFGGAINLAMTPNIKELSWLLLVPVLTFVVYYFSMKLTRKLSYHAPAADDPAMGCSNKMMDLMMPIMSVFITFAVPSAIGVYWIFKSLIGMVKQVILYFAMPVPQFSEEDYKAAEKEMNNGKPVDAPRAKPASSGKVRSLHHIDDDDYDENGRLKESAAQSAPKQESAKASDSANETDASSAGGNAAQEGNSPIDRAPLKKDDKKRDRK